MKSFIYKFVKRLFDIVISIIGMFFVLLLSIIIKSVFLINKNFNSIFFVQDRVGINGKNFKIYKFKTMYEDSSNLKKYLSNKRIKEYKTNHKLTDDPRITKFGKILRKISLDEIPQFINVLKGDMSIIGPRPFLTSEIKNNNSKYKKILTCKPGITGWWACNGRNELSYKERIELELYYVDNQSILLDLKIIFKTIIILITCRGAE